MPKVWFITGASTGFGRAIAEAARDAGDTVVATARTAADVADFDTGLALDVTDPAQVSTAVARAIAAHGRIDVLVNNAGHGLVGTVEEVTDADLRDLLDVNLFGAWRLAREVAPHLRAQRGGHIFQMSSVGGVVGNPGHAVYATSKFALEGMSEALAGELAPWGVRVTLIEPGPFRTGFAGRSIAAARPIADYAPTPAGRLRANFQHQDGRQPNDPARAADIVVRLAAAENPPLRLPLGPEAVARIRAKLHRQLVSIDEWETVALDTRF